jgi:hypothetical protein
MSLTTTRRDGSAMALVTAGAAVITLIVVVRVALLSDRGQHWDDWSRWTVFAGRDAQLTLLSVLGYVSIGGIIAVAALCVGSALVRGRVRLAFVAVGLIAGANVTTQLLKHVVLQRPDFGVGTLNSLPSGHTTVVASGTAALVLVAPPAVRAVCATLGSFAVTLTGTSTIVAGWHRPADIVAALAVCLLWTSLAAAVVGPARRPSGGSGLLVLLGAGSALLFLIAVGVRPLLGWDGFFQGGLVLGTVAAVTAVYVWLVVRVAPTE